MIQFHPISIEISSNICFGSELLATHSATQLDLLKRTRSTVYLDESNPCSRLLSPIVRAHRAHHSCYLRKVCPCLELHILTRPRGPHPSLTSLHDLHLNETGLKIRCPVCNRFPLSSLCECSSSFKASWLCLECIVNIYMAISFLSPFMLLVNSMPAPSLADSVFKTCKSTCLVRCFVQSNRCREQGHESHETDWKGSHNTSWRSGLLKF